MAGRVTTGLYDFDPNKSNTNNLIVGELHTISPPADTDFYFMIPYAAPYFVDSLQVFNHANGNQYVEGVDYIVGHYFLEAMRSIGRPIAGSIRLLNRSISGVVRLTYHTLGDQWGFNETAILEELSNRSLNPIVRSWGMISNLPATFPPLPHDQRVDDLVGTQHLLAAIEAVAAAVQAAGEGSTAQHLDDFTNPHNVTKAQVGLGSVQNYPVSTANQARDGGSDSAYMTPLRTAQAIAHQVGNALSDHINNNSNPHSTTKEQVGLSQVENYPVASPSEAVDPSRNDRYLTPFSGSLLLQQQGEGARVTALETLVDQHINNSGNPHNTTASQVGAYSRDEVDQLLANVSGGGSNTFAGMNEQEWRESLPSFDDLTVILEKLQTEYGAASSGALDIEVGAITLPAQSRPLSANVGHERFAVILNDRRLYELPTPTIYGRLYEGWYGSVAFIDGASYYVDPDGFIIPNGPNAITPPSNYQAGGTPPALMTRLITARSDRVYMVLEDGQLYEYTASGGATIRNNVFEFRMAQTSHLQAVTIGTDGTMTGMGSTNFVNNFNAAVSGIGDIDEVAIGRDRIYAVDEGGTLRGWSITDPTGAATVTPLTLPSELQTTIVSASGVLDHYVFVTETGLIYVEGTGDGDMVEIPQDHGPYIDAAAWTDYTVTVSQDGRVLYWGNSDDNRFIVPDTFEE